ncbi:DNA-directed RNA polymerase subunit beta' [Candidatus Wolfebacteria bacterium]|nr:MAG: DNA-directed RNA polymerase subunit beta' [Candidatus Wolfebacteria bacterium]
MKKVYEQKQNHSQVLALRLASPEKIHEWSFGEVTKPETINYRTQRSEKGGLFDEKIFGPEKDYECYCGKYRGIRYKGIECEKCGVEITRSIVRRERMGHIELASPVSHIWFLRGIPSRIGLMLGINASDLEKVIYFAGYIVTKVQEAERSRILKELETEYKTKVKTLQDDRSKEALKELFTTMKHDIESIKEGVVLDEVKYHKYAVKFGTIFEAGIGAEAIYDILKGINLEKLTLKLEEAHGRVGAIERAKIDKRLGVIKAMDAANVRPEWMFLKSIPVIPPGLRPMVALTGGRHATSDVNDLYRRVINRNNRLKKLLAIMAPDVILRNEKRILQEAVDALIDNSIRHGNSAFSAMSQAQRRPLKSLSDNLKGKQGLLRQNLLGKRVDYSGRSVIVVGPTLLLHECGLPKHMALELFRPFIISQLLKQELAYNIRGAGKLIDERRDEVWSILEDVIRDKYVLLNRAPTLHRLGMQAFQPKLIEGNAIQVHPLVCTAFNADFDGDQMAVHVPLSEKAQIEAREFMASNKNLLSPGTGDAIVSAKQDIVLGCYWVTKQIDGATGEGKIFTSPQEAIMGNNFGYVDYRAKIKVLPPEGKEKFEIFNGELFETTVGRLLFNEILPEDYPYLNQETDKKTMSALADDLIVKYGIDGTPPILDRMKTFGFKYMTHSGITFGMDEVQVPVEKPVIIAAAQEKSDAINEQFNDGLLSEEERRRKNTEIWHGAKGEVEKVMPKTLDPNGSVSDMLTSGARGSLNSIVQMSGMKGLIQNTAGETIEYPVISSAKEGLSPIEYFRTTHGSRKGLADTALNTAKAGYLTRRLFVVAQDAIISELDCGTKRHIILKKESISGIDVPISKNLKGRYIAESIINGDGEVMYKKGSFITNANAKEVEEAGVEEVKVFSPLTCDTPRGLCRKCYGKDLGSNEPVELGEAVGTIAAQAVGEPATQLTMRTFHSGGTASVGGDITSGLPRVEEVFERRAPKNPAIVASVSGTVTEIKDLGKEKLLIVVPDIEDKPKTKKAKSEIEYTVSFRRMPLVAVGDKFKKGQMLTDGSADLQELFKYAGLEITQQYVIRETSKIYELQGAAVSRKHIEVIVRQMFARRKITDRGDTSLAVGEVVENALLDEKNEEMKESGGAPAVGKHVVLGITEVSLTRNSFLSAASFQHTTKVLINSAIKGNSDPLRGLMENVIIGQLIPAGTGFSGSPKSKLVEGADQEVVEDGE